MELTTREAWEELSKWKLMNRKDLLYKDVAGRQIISALLAELNIRFADGYLYRVLQGVASEARRRHLLINPNWFTRETYSSAVGNTDRMLPSLRGGEQTKGILARHINDAREHLKRQALKKQ